MIFELDNVNEEEDVGMFTCHVHLKDDPMNQLVVSKEIENLKCISKNNTE